MGSKNIVWLFLLHMKIYLQLIPLEYITCWPAIRRNLNGIIFIYSPTHEESARKLDLFYSYFVAQNNLSPKKCIIFSHQNDFENDDDDYKSNLPSVFSRMSKTNVNLKNSSDKLRADFNTFLATVVNNM